MDNFNYTFEFTLKGCIRMSEVIIEKYYVVSLGEGKYVGFITEDETVSNINSASKFENREEASKYRDWIRETYVGKVEVCEINIVAKIENSR
jgi:hypothetical protein